MRWRPIVCIPAKTTLSAAFGIGPGRSICCLSCFTVLGSLQQKTRDSAHSEGRFESFFFSSGSLRLEQFAFITAKVCATDWRSGRNGKAAQHPRTRCNESNRFFYDKGTPKGAIYEALEEFQRFVNQKLPSGTLGVRITYLPMAPAQLEAALTEGIGDLVANAVAITPEREQKFAFSSPIQTGLT